MVSSWILSMVKNAILSPRVDATLIDTGRAPFTKGLGLENVPNLYCIGDANGKLMLAHAASAQGISVVEQICGKDNILNHLSIPTACFTHPKISMVGLTKPQAREKADREGFEVSVVKTSFKANTRLWRRTKEMDLLRYILGLHAADLSHEASNAIALGTRVQDIKFVVHAHPILSEVLDSSSRLPRLMWR